MRSVLAMGQQDQPLDLRRQRLAVVLRQLAADLADERRRRVALEREVRQLRQKLATYEQARFLPNQDRRQKR
jgi:hypothetical protein